MDELEEIISLAKGKASELDTVAAIAVLNGEGNLIALHGTRNGNTKATVEALANAQSARAMIRFKMAWGLDWQQLPVNITETPSSKGCPMRVPQGVPIYRQGLIIGYIGVAGSSDVYNFSIAASGAALHSKFAYREN